MWGRQELVRTLGRAAGGVLAAPLTEPLAWATAGAIPSAGSGGPVPDGGHELPLSVAREAIEWFLGPAE